MNVPPLYRKAANNVPTERTREHAERLARMIKDKWREAGHPHVVAWVDTTPRPGSERGEYLYELRSNLIGGLPPVLARA